MVRAEEATDFGGVWLGHVLQSCPCLRDWHNPVPVSEPGIVSVCLYLALEPTLCCPLRTGKLSLKFKVSMGRGYSLEP